MPQLSVACRDFISEEACSVRFLAETDEDLVEAAIEHAYASHNEEDTPSLRELVRLRAASAVLT